MKKNLEACFFPLLMAWCILIVETDPLFAKELGFSQGTFEICKKPIIVSKENLIKAH